MNTISDPNAEKFPVSREKGKRRASIAFHFARFLAVNPTPCRCTPKIPPCDCSDFCRCELELEFCECSAEWPLEYLDLIGDWLAVMDPSTYAPRPHPETREMYWIAWDVRLETLAARFESGYSLWHERDRQRDVFKNGEKAERLANGAIIGGPSSLADNRVWKPKTAS